MSNWITDRPPTYEDAGPVGIVWTTYNGKSVPWSYDGVAEGTPWMPITPPEPYVKPKTWRVAYNGVEQLEAQHAAVCAHMMRLFYALVSFTNPQPDDDADEVMAEAKQAVELYINDPSMCVTVELPDDESEVTP